MACLLFLVPSRRFECFSHSFQARPLWHHWQLQLCKVKNPTILLLLEEAPRFCLNVLWIIIGLNTDEAFFIFRRDKRCYFDLWTHTLWAAESLKADEKTSRQAAPISRGTLVVVCGLPLDQHPQEKRGSTGVTEKKWRAPVVSRSTSQLIQCESVMMTMMDGVLGRFIRNRTYKW